ncbi:MAG: nucleoside 2-deoxyribosyltransferase [Chloroflexota bacterium]
MKIYIAGPLFNAGERWYLENIDRVCHEAGFETYLPHRDAGLVPPSGDGNEFFFNEDRKQLNECDVVVAVLNGVTTDPGTAWEIGYAHAIKCPIIAIYDDKRIADPKANINPMIYCSVEMCKTMEELKEKLKTMNNETMNNDK